MELLLSLVCVVLVAGPCCSWPALAAATVVVCRAAILLLLAVLPLNLIFCVQNADDRKRDEVLRQSVADG